MTNEKHMYVYVCVCVCVFCFPAVFCPKGETCAVSVNHFRGTDRSSKGKLKTLTCRDSVCYVYSCLFSMEHF